MSHGDGTEAHGGKRHAQQAGLDALAPLAGLHLVELQVLALVDSHVQVLLAGLDVLAPLAGLQVLVELHVHILSPQLGLHAQEQGEQGQAQDHR